jgi:hypothetical protein
MLRVSVCTLVTLVACTGGMQDPATVEQQNGACEALEGRTFSSVNELECGLTPDGISRCHWQLVFATRDTLASEFAWSYSDLTENGRAECHGQAITATASRKVTASFDAATQMLVWDGEVYSSQ